jgi:hypothetical protein
MDKSVDQFLGIEDEFVARPAPELRNRRNSQLHCIRDTHRSA